MKGFIPLKFGPKTWLCITHGSTLYVAKYGKFLQEGLLFTKSRSFTISAHLLRWRGEVLRLVIKKNRWIFELFLELHFSSYNDLICKTSTVVFNSSYNGLQSEWCQDAEPVTQLHYPQFAFLCQGEDLQLRWKSKDSSVLDFWGLFLKCLTKFFHKVFTMFSLPLGTQFHFSEEDLKKNFYGTLNTSFQCGQLLTEGGGRIHPGCATLVCGLFWAEDNPSRLRKSFLPSPWLCKRI